jgi:para-aminobenzoate synthetase / 4-amino-4-deoxychorismate lyase
LRQIEAEPAWTVLALDYELGYLLEPRSAPPGWQADGRPLARFWRFRERIEMSAADAAQWLADHAPGQPAGIAGWHETTGEGAYIEAIERIKAWIAAGDCYQVNFTFPVDFDWLVRRSTCTPGCVSASRCVTVALSAMVGKGSFRCRRNCSSSVVATAC